MNKKFKIIIALLFSGLLAFGQGKKVCITLDDLPLVNYDNNDSLFYTQTFVQIADTLSKFKVPAMGFVNVNKLYVNNAFLPYRLALLQYWVAKGLQLGNHTYSHLSFQNATLKQYTAAILKGEQHVKDLYHTNENYRYFRHPFLQIGDNKARADTLERLLDSLQYKTAPVTIDNDDYIFASAYQKAMLRQDSALALKIKNDYLHYLEKKLRYYESNTQELFGTNMAHIFLIHNNWLNAVSLSAILQMFQKHQYQFVPLQEALKDPAYHTPISRYGDYGISWLHLWALGRIKRKGFFETEPQVPVYVFKYMKE